MNEVFKEGLKILNKLQETQGDKLELAGRIIGKSFMEGHNSLLQEAGILILWQRNFMHVLADWHLWFQFDN